MVLHPDRRSPCRDCGFDGSTVSPGDAAVAARSFARRWRELFHEVAEHDPRGDAILHLQLASGWRPVDRVRRLVHVFDRLATQLEHVWAKDDPYLDGIADEPAAVSSSTDDALRELDRAAGRLAEVIDRYDAEQWSRTGRRIGGSVTALEVALEAIHEGSHQLRVCQRELERQLGRRLAVEEDDRWTDDSTQAR